jgi:hypothetical protein
MSNISVLRIIKNKIGYKRPVIYILLSLLIVLFLIFFRNLALGTIFIVFIIIYTMYLIIYIIKEIIKINYYFKNGIETIAHVYKNTRAFPFYRLFQVTLINKLLFSGEDNKEEIKNGVCYRYNINGEIYESNYIFKENNETAYIKEGSKINIYANPKNKNETIIKDLFIKI